jgi:hypothetical protein
VSNTGRTVKCHYGESVYKPLKIVTEHLNRIATDDTERILRALIAAFYTQPPDWVETRCFTFATHSGVAAPNGVALGLGNISSCYGLNDLNRAETVLEVPVAIPILW